MDGWKKIFPRKGIRMLKRNGEELESVVKELPQRRTVRAYGLSVITEATTGSPDHWDAWTEVYRHNAHNTSGDCEKFRDRDLISSRESE